MIELHNVTYSYPKQNMPTLRDISLQISPGTFLLVVGPSGAGKSTLLRTINGLVPHFYGGALQGRVRVEERDPVEFGPRGMSDLVGLVFQNPEAQFVTQLVEDELAFAMENLNFSQALMRRRVEEALDQLSIADLRGRKVETLSGGQKQLVAIASVLTLQPSILVLDEPTSQLDPQAAEEVLTILQKLNMDLGLTIVLSEHRLERVAQYADRICYLPRRGASPLLGAPREVLAQVDLVPPLVELGRKLDWQPMPLTIKESRPFAENLKRKWNGFRAPAPRPPAPGGTGTTKGVTTSGAGVIGTTKVVTTGLGFRYGEREVLKSISFELGAGELVALMGRNGSGKSTLLKNIVGLLKPQRGGVRVNGQDPAAIPLEQIARHVGFVPQNPGRLLFNETVQGELEFTCRAHNLGTEKIAGLLEQLGLSELREAYPRDLSTGERQRVALASILIAEPGALLLDEPTRGLDYVSKEKLLAILKRLRAQGVTILMASHDVELVAQCATRILLLGNGDIVADGTTRHVMNDSLVFAPQVNKALRDERFLTVADVLALEEAHQHAAQS
ncbi:MAG: energy-coupling factor ABC transporter ATP-binding protein [Anaerolineae bacterium]|nr:energy-coupling factor ABC transporter ATP-binding protein [Anaerolineae bacterium]